METYFYREEMKALLRQSIVIFPKLINLELFNTVAVYYILSDVSNSDMRPEIWHSRSGILISGQWFESGFED